jgi:hypothetical protein
MRKWRLFGHGVRMEDESSEKKRWIGISREPKGEEN